MTRSRASAKQAGSKFERAIADYLRDAIGDDRIDRRVKTGSKDRGDVGGVRTFGGGRVVIEAKDTARINLGSWIAEAHDEMRHDDAVAGVIAHKRHGRGNPADQWVTMTLADLVAILTGERPALDADAASQRGRQAPPGLPVSLSDTPTIPTPQIP